MFALEPRVIGHNFYYSRPGLRAFWGNMQDFCRSVTVWPPALYPSCTSRWTGLLLTMSWCDSPKRSRSTMHWREAAKPWTRNYVPSSKTCTICGRNFVNPLSRFNSINRITINIEFKVGRGTSGGHVPGFRVINKIFAANFPDFGYSNIGLPQFLSLFLRSNFNTVRNVTLWTVFPIPK